MFPEMAEDEFKDVNFPPSELIPMEVDELANHHEYFLELERPYGSYTTQLLFKVKDGELAGSEQPEPPKEVQEPLLAYFRDKCVPVPISRDE